MKSPFRADYSTGVLEAGKRNAAILRALRLVPYATLRGYYANATAAKGEDGWEFPPLRKRIVAFVRKRIYTGFAVIPY
jgi:hypothetical protein